ncbi:MAG: NADH-quinone oxidoreductase subunit L [Candidatus Acidiferrales bacterium]
MTPLPFFLDHIWLIPLFPLAAATVMLLYGRRLNNNIVSAMCVGSVAISFFLSCGAFFQLLHRPISDRVAQKILFEWVPVGVYHTQSGAINRFVADWGFLLDPLSAVMILIVTGVGLLIHIYSIGYMAHEGGYYRFFGYLNLFMFAMLTLVLANNLLLLFVGWEGVGLCSYLLIGFWFKKKSAADAGKKAFIVNRIGDAGFLLGIFLVSAVLGTIRFSEIGPAISAAHLELGAPVLTAMALLFFVGATGKSAQIPLYVWLPDAMEGPTPVSALIHAATMVTAGVYMVTRTNFVFQMAPVAMEIVAGIGAATAIFAASIGVLQNDIKKVLAYSTVSQLGYMFLACGVGAFTAGIFHLMTHAFFKGLLFLASGSVIHALSGEQDMRKMGGLRDKIPITFWTMLIGTLAIAGIFPFAGFLSKDLILGKVYEHSMALWLVGYFTAGMTAFYMFRLIFLTFFGASRVEPEVEHHIHESPPSMTGPLVILAVLSIVGGWISWPEILKGSSRFVHFLEPIVAQPQQEHIEAAQGVGSRLGEIQLMLLSEGLVLLGILLAWYLYLKRADLAENVALGWKRLYNLVYNKYYVDEIYNAVFVNRTKDLATTLGAFDSTVIDGLGVNGAGWLTRFVSSVSIWWDSWIVDGSVRLGARIVWLTSYPVRMMQNGLLQTYMLLIVIGILGFFGYYWYFLQHQMH